ncbi:MAG: site-2 protease family protein [Bacteroidetes bacterium]|nr:site-2 protease family protein [Bacteroidota bacterium]
MTGLNPEHIIVVLPAIIIGLTFHEYMHAKVAHLLGDDTAFLQGRVTINPFKHIDWFGFMFLLFAGFGWAKPVSFNPEKLKNPRRDEMLIAVAAPFANLMLAIFFAFLLKLLGYFMFVDGYLLLMIIYCISINYGLFFFNLIPIPPLDGSHLLVKSLKFSKENETLIFKYGSIVLLALVIIDSQTSFDILPIGKAMRFLTTATLNLFGIQLSI